MTRFEFLLAAALSVAVSPAFGLTITFGSSSASLPYEESGFRFVQTVGSQGSVLDLTSTGPALSMGVLPFPSVGDTIEMTPIGGGTFTFDQLDAVAARTSTNDAFDIRGFVGTSVTKSLLGVAQNTAGSTTLASGFSAPVESVSFVLASLGSEVTFFDNIVVNAAATAVPVPAGLPLLLAGLGGLVLLRRRAG